MSGQILFHAGRTSRILRIICSSDRRGVFRRFSENPFTFSTSDCCQRKVSLTIQTKHTHLLWHLLYNRHLCLPIGPTLEVRFVSFRPLSQRFIFQSVLCFSYFGSIMPRHRHRTYQLWINWGTLSHLSFIHCVLHYTWKLSVKSKLPRLSTFFDK